MTPQETDPDLPLRVQESHWRLVHWWPAARSGALSAAVSALELLKELTIIFITSILVWPQVK